MAAFFNGENRSDHQVKVAPRIDADLELPLVYLRRYLFYLSRRPISVSNLHYRSARLEGLKSLSTLFSGRSHPVAERACNLLDALTPANISQLAHTAELQLRRIVPFPRPRDLVVTTEAPSEDFFQGVRRVLLAFGPGIGIGDEIICLPVPGRLKRLDLEVTVLTAYSGLWDGIAGVHAIETYQSGRHLIKILRSSGSRSPWDLVVMVDFETPGLSLPMHREPKVDKYIEISLGNRSCVALDKSRSRTHHMVPFDPYFKNFYNSLDHTGSWLGVKAQPLDREQIVERRVNVNKDKRDFVVLVSPFTSKQDPFPAYWAELLAAICIEDSETGLRFVFDTGPNQMTESFGQEVMRAARAQAPWNVRFEFARAKRRYASLEDILECLKVADLVTAADSYLAHAAPIFGVPALVVARRGTEIWRVPESRNFYFGISEPIARTAAAMQVILRELIHGNRGEREETGLRERAECQRLIRAGQRVHLLLSDGKEVTAATLHDAWSEFHAAYSRVAFERGAWPRAFDGLIQDKEYDYLISPWPEAFGAESAPLPRDLLLHLRDHFAEWRNSNLQKYLNGLDGAPGVRQ
jgi:hypothetical protein